jgi:hypothetical protein
MFPVAGVVRGAISTRGAWLGVVSAQRPAYGAGNEELEMSTGRRHMPKRSHTLIFRIISLRVVRKR